jgi:Sugar (and other) transporter
MGTPAPPPLGCLIHGSMALHRRWRHGRVRKSCSPDPRKPEFDMASHWTAFKSCHCLHISLRGDLRANLVRQDRCGGNRRGPTAWVYVSEIYPLKYRAKANGLCAATNCIRFDTPVNGRGIQLRACIFRSPSFQEYSMEDLYCSSPSCISCQIFGVFCVAMFVQVFFMFPETRQKGLEEIGT